MHFAIPASQQGQDDQHVVLADATWSIWRWSLLRGTGFPITYPLSLAVPECAQQADALLQSEHDVQQTRQATVRLFQESRSDNPEQRKQLTNIIHDFHANKSPRVDLALPPHLQEAITTLAQAQQRHATAQMQFQRIHTESLQNAGAVLQTIAQSEPFRQAIVWQNRHLLESCVDHFLTKPLDSSGRDYLRNRSMVVKYLQRYTLKNDTIGFFGPVGWIRWDNTVALTTSQPGLQVLARRTTYLEGWGINELSHAIAQDSALLPWAVPRLAYQMSVEQNRLHIPFARPIALSPAQAAILSCCTGEHTAYDIAQRLIQQHIPGLATADDIYAILAQMHKMHRISWSFDVTLETLFPAQDLRRNLQRIGPPDLRAAALEKLDEYERATANVPIVQEDAEQLNQAIQHVETVFTALTGATATRSAGQAYAGRTLLYEDCARDITMTLGAQVLHALEIPLTLLLTSARWLTYHLAQACRAYLRAAYIELTQNQGQSTVEFAEFFPRITTHLAENEQALFGSIREQFLQKWAEILELPQGERQVAYDPFLLAAKIQETFDAPGPGWDAAHFHSPDVMIAASSVEAINRGEFQFVLGELHIGMNTLGVQLFTGQHPHISDLQAAIAQDLPEPQILPLAPSYLIPASRSQQALALPKDFRLITSNDICDASPDRTLRMGDLLVQMRSESLQVRTRNGSHTFEALELIGDFFSFMIADYFDIIAPLPHSPRITFDRLVVKRETWRIPVSQVAQLTTKDASISYLNTRRWAQEQGMPRYLFYRTPTERKPCFLDLASPLSVDLFVREIRRLMNTDVVPDARITVSEMLPSPEQVWLADSKGNRYTSEIRIAAVDRKDRLQ